MPDLLLLDEAFSSIDPKHQDLFFGLLKDYQKDHPITVLFVTHKSEEISKLADYVAVMEKGKINKIIDKNDKTINSILKIMENISGADV